ncbi:beta-N-acetylhexosaminidase [Bacteroidia bacterium]|nr:beta-N-acetylhexosaminidase [Bacteroidia bacterium]GHT26192.1 beta-N-acetylhexosaminidase [Bacteroidia bacterium]GHT86176.1 beta-N-acetylhexosaminidase [Bacteroidia bacterium]
MNKNLFFLSAILFCLTACGDKTDLTKAALIPQPVSVAANGEAFKITNKTVIYITSESDELKQVGQFLSDLLQPATGFSIPIEQAANDPKNGIWLSLTDDKELKSEGYRLSVNKQLIKLQGNTAEGVFHGIQTIRQLLPAAIEAKSIQQESWIIAGGEILDYPEYVYRGGMLDVARHFFSVADVKVYIDLLASYKINTFHWHLSDDQGWRIEIKSWPKLTEIGGSSEVDGGKGGFYTQEEYKDIVAYAAARYITVIPEIDMPGHTNAALASYAELNSDGKATELYTGIKVGFSSLSIKKEITYQFVDDVIRELAAITPGEYIHAGGDESNATKEEDYITFVNKVQAIVLSHGKKMIGWDEMAHASLDKSTIVQYWAREKNAKLAAEQGIKAIFSPAKKAYMDMQYDSITPIGLHWAGYLDIKTSYDWEPTLLEEGLGRENIIGIEAPLWTETIKTLSDIEYMVLPRLLGIAEIGWTPANLRNWDNYKVRLNEYQQRFKIQGFNAYPFINE